MNRIQKIKRNLLFLWHSLFYAMKAGDNEITQQEGNGNNSEVKHQVSADSVMNDLLNQEETEKVKELRDAYYRVLTEADKYHVDVDLHGIIGKDGELSNEGGEITYKIRKKTSADFSQHCKVDETDGLKLRVIQDNKPIQKKLDTSFVVTNNNPFDYLTLIEIERDGFKPKFEIEKIATKVVVKDYTNTDAVIELYLPTQPMDFNSLSALYQSELKKMFTDKNYKTETSDILSISFVTDKAWNSEDLCLFKYDNLKYEGISVFDGSYILRFIGRIVNDGTSLFEKYKTKELDEKYKNKAPKSDTVDISAAEREVEGIDFSKKILEIK